MESLLEALYDGEIFPDELIVPQNPDYRQKHQKESEEMEFWKRQLTSEEYDRMSKFLRGKGSYLVAEIKFCEYNYDTGRIDVIFTDGQKMAVPRNRIEDTLDLASAMRSKFDWLIFNEPETFVKLSLCGEF